MGTEMNYFCFTLSFIIKFILFNLISNGQYCPFLFYENMERIVVSIH